MTATWRLVLYELDPPIAVPLSTAFPVERLRADLHAQGFLAANAQLGFVLCPTAEGRDGSGVAAAADSGRKPCIDCDQMDPVDEFGWCVTCRKQRGIDAGTRLLRRTGGWLKMRGPTPTLYVVLPDRSPPVAVPLSTTRALHRFWDLHPGSSEAQCVVECTPEDEHCRQLLEALTAGPADQRHAVLETLNTHIMATRSTSFWSCHQCDGPLYRPSECDCCRAPDCAVRCGCRCPSEFAECARCGGGPDYRCMCGTCDGCGKEGHVTELGFCVSCVHELGLKYGDEECLVCGRPGELDAAEWCRSCKRQHAIDTETPCSNED